MDTIKLMLTDAAVIIGLIILVIAIFIVAFAWLTGMIKRTK